MPEALSGLNGIAGITALSEQEPFATPEERMGGAANPAHSELGEKSKPYAWESQMVQAGGHGPYGPENQLLDDEFWFIEPGGTIHEDPLADLNTPDITRSHGSVHNVTISGPVPSQYDAIGRQLSQMVNKSSDLGTSRSMTHDQQGYAQQDDWRELWELNPGHDDVPMIGKQFGFTAFGFGTNDRPSNAYRKTNLYGYDSSHMHRRYAAGHLPGNYMWMRPQGRPMFKTLAGPARPAIGSESPFQGDDLGYSFSYDTGAILQSTPQEYVPPPSPNVNTYEPVYDDPYGTNAIEMW